MCGCKTKIGAMNATNLKGYPMERLAMVGVGAVGSEFAVNSLINNMTKDKPDSFLLKKGVGGGLKIGLGVGLIMFGKKTKGLSDVGLGCIAAGGLDIARNFLQIPTVAVKGIYFDDDQVRGFYPNLDMADYQEEALNGPMSTFDNSDFGE